MSDNSILVVLPVTTTSLSREEGTGSYLHASTVHNITDYSITIASNQTTASIIVTTVDNHGLQVGDWVFIDGVQWPVTLVSGDWVINGNDPSIIFAAGRLNGLFRVSIIGTSTIFGFNIENTILGPLPTQHITNTGTVAAVAQPVNTEFPGPYIFDPVDGISITDTSTDIEQSIPVGSTNPVLTVSSTNGWPNTPGWVAIGYGSSYFDRPIKYVGVQDSTHLQIDPNYVFPKNISSGTDVTLLYSKAPWIPPNITSVGAFWATANTAGVNAAITDITAIVASGVDLTFDVIYPGDTGLGAAGYPTSGNGKLSSITQVYDINGE